MKLIFVLSSSLLLPFFGLNQANQNKLPAFFDSADIVEPISEEEDQILRKIEMGQPSQPYIRIGENYTDLFGKWRTIDIDDKYWTLSKADLYSGTGNSHGIFFHYRGKVQEYLPGDSIFTERKRISYLLKDSILEFTVENKDHKTHIFSYVPVKYENETLTFRKVKTSGTSLQHYFRNDLNDTTFQVNEQVINYSRDKCIIESFTLNGRYIWQTGLGNYGCNLILIDKMNGKTGKSGLFIQFEDKQAFVLNLKTGKLKRIRAKEFN